MIYHIYGRDIAANLLKAEYDAKGLKVTGFSGNQSFPEETRNFENYYVNGRYAKNNIISRAIEDAYKDFTMQHKYPFVVLHIEIDGEHVDVNVHPTKMELRFNNQQEVYNAIYSAVDQGLHEKELIPHVEMPGTKAGCFQYTGICAETKDWICFSDSGGGPDRRNIRNDWWCNIRIDAATEKSNCAASAGA